MVGIEEVAEKVGKLADLIEKHVFFDDIDDARMVADSYKAEHDSSIALRVHAMAVDLYRRRHHYGIADHLHFGHGGSTIKTGRLREAIRECAGRFIKELEAEPAAAQA